MTGDLEGEMNCSEALSTALFVKGLAKGATERHLHAIFSQFGVVDESQVGFLARCKLHSKFQL